MTSVDGANDTICRCRLQPQRLRPRHLQIRAACRERETTVTNTYHVAASDGADYVNTAAQLQWTVNTARVIFATLPALSMSACR